MMSSMFSFASTEEMLDSDSLCVGYSLDADSGVVGRCALLYIYKKRERERGRGRGRGRKGGREREGGGERALN
jgi:hypothetical protein